MKALTSRRRTGHATFVAMTLLLVLGAASCDTGDGKQLRPVDPSVTTLPPPPTSADVATLPDGEQIVVTEPVAAFELFAPWSDGGAIDVRYTCDADDIAPALSWASPPEGTDQLAFSLVDESATDGNGAPFVHWVIAGIEPTDVSLIEGVAPSGAAQAINSFGEVGWSGPCPPNGQAPHNYRLTMSALNQQVELADGTPAEELLEFIESVTIESTTLVGTYQR